MKEKLLEAIDIKKHFPITKGLITRKILGYVKAIDGVDFCIYKGDSFSLVGESGCGKTTTTKCILLLESLSSGSLLFENKDISKLTPEEIKGYRSSVQAMFQDPYSSLSPRMRVRDILSEPIEINLELTKKKINERIDQILTEVKLPPGSAKLYPHEFSGGQRQRIALARAIAIEPKLIVLDEPVSALDVSVQAQLMNLLMDIQQKRKFTYLIIAHNLAVVRYLSNRMGVMYLGKIVEYGKSEAIYCKSLHPYTKALFSAALPSQPDSTQEEIILPGEVPTTAINPPSGCHFHPRCFYAKDICYEVEPPMEEAGTDHKVACHFWKEINH
ncbi:MAG: oligopeptide/dipeptide ABC transporter ATP-binding protein [Pseudomonadota bacterium]